MKKIIIFILLVVSVTSIQAEDFVLSKAQPSNSSLAKDGGILPSITFCEMECRIDRVICRQQPDPWGYCDIAFDQCVKACDPY
jgi:hypothetical protein